MDGSTWNGSSWGHKATGFRWQSEWLLILQVRWHWCLSAVWPGSPSLSWIREGALLLQRWSWRGWAWANLPQLWWRKRRWVGMSPCSFEKFCVLFILSGGNALRKFWKWFKYILQEMVELLLFLERFGPQNQNHTDLSNLLYFPNLRNHSNHEIHSF